MIIINLGHSMTDDQLRQIQELRNVSWHSIMVRHVHARVNMNLPLAPQVDNLLEKTGVTDEQWQTEEILFVPATTSHVSLLAVSAMEKKIGHKPDVIRIAKDYPGSYRYVIAEIYQL